MNPPVPGGRPPPRGAPPRGGPRGRPPPRGMRGRGGPPRGMPPRQDSQGIQVELFNMISQ